MERAEAVVAGFEPMAVSEGPRVPPRLRSCWERGRIAPRLVSPGRSHAEALENRPHKAGEKPS